MTIEPDSPPEFRQLRLAAAPFAFQQPVYGWGEPEEIVRSDQEYSLIFVVDVDHTKVLLGMKRRGMGVGLYNGFGGKRDPGETMLQCAARELYEESGISANEDALYHKGTLYTSRPLKGGAKGMRKQMIKISVFACFSWTGVPIETEEMTPQWFDIDKLPTQRMVS
ncbi:hypothetical protein IAR55_005480 [Kwoniella newhampshirensis]|uniref:Nudix hydrolase domain-containing protein n=1 Tax=Kwoniella newhampshirensis TaxID=1651941 RepID=A0AAW0YVY5_9TREE